MTKYIFTRDVRKELESSMRLNDENRYSREILELTVLFNIEQALREICEQLEGIKNRITSDVI